MVTQEQVNHELDIEQVEALPDVVSAGELAIRIAHASSSTLFFALRIGAKLTVGRIPGTDRPSAVLECYPTGCIPFVGEVKEYQAGQEDIAALWAVTNKTTVRIVTPEPRVTCKFLHVAVISALAHAPDGAPSRFSTNFSEDDPQASGYVFQGDAWKIIVSAHSWVDRLTLHTGVIPNPHEFELPLKQ